MSYQLTKYSHGAGCGCKISPKVLASILEGSRSWNGEFPELLVGNATNDDAAVFSLGNGTAMVSTTDFFMPIVDDAEDFGRIASVNAISDIYAMGGRPLMAIAILGWPVDKLPESVAAEVIKGARDACREAGIPLAGGHSIDSPEPIFGLAVTGTVAVDRIKQNAGARPGDLLYLTKPLGVGILTTAVKQGRLAEPHKHIARDSMVRLNSIGLELAQIEGVSAMTDVTGFGLAGHLVEMCEASNAGASLWLDKIPLLDADAIDHYIGMGCIPGGTNRNFSSYGNALGALTDRHRAIVCDPQTSGGLLVAVRPDSRPVVEQLLASEKLHAKPIGEVTSKGNPLIAFTTI